MTTRRDDGADQPDYSLVCACGVWHKTDCPLFTPTPETRRDDGADQPRCHNGHPFEPGVAEDNAPSDLWCNVCGERRRDDGKAIGSTDGLSGIGSKPAALADQPRPRWYIDWWNLAFVAVFLIGYIVGRVS